MKNFIKKFKEISISKRVELVINITLTIVLLIVFLKSTSSNRVLFSNSKSNISSESGRYNVMYNPTKYYSFGIDSHGNFIFSPVADGEVVSSAGDE